MIHMVIRMVIDIHYLKADIVPDHKWQLSILIQVLDRLKKAL